MERMTGKLAAHYQDGNYAVIGANGKEYVAAKGSVIYEQDAIISFVPAFQGPIIMATDIEFVAPKIVTPDAAVTEITPAE